MALRGVGRVRPRDDHASRACELQPDLLRGAGGNAAAAEVAAHLDRLEPGEREIVAALRNAVRRAVPDAEETIAWGTLSYHTPWIGGRVKGALCQVSVRRGEVRLEFIHGVRLADPADLLQGSRKSKRYVPILAPAEARRPAIVALVRAASEVEFPAP